MAVIIAGLRLVNAHLSQFGVGIQRLIAAGAKQDFRLNRKVLRQEQTHRHRGAVLERDPSDARSRMMLAMSLFSLGKFQDAGKAFAMIPDAAMQDARAARTAAS